MPDAASEPRQSRPAGEGARPKGARPRQSAFRFSPEVNALLDRLVESYRTAPLAVVRRAAVVEQAIRELAARRLE